MEMGTGQITIRTTGEESGKSAMQTAELKATPMTAWGTSPVQRIQTEVLLTIVTTVRERSARSLIRMDAVRYSAMTEKSARYCI